MKKSNLIITLAVALVLSLSSIGAALGASGVFAAGSSSMQSTQGAIQFDAPSGIRWNNGKKAFEIFNAAGVTYIASEQFVNATGDIAANGDIAGYEKMDGLHTYHIMQDIVYEDTTAMFAPHKTTAPDFSGVLDGRGFTLYNFPIKHRNNHASYGACLFSFFYGTIKNLNIHSDEYTRVAATIVHLSVLTCISYGVIENSYISGVFEFTALQRIFPFAERQEAGNITYSGSNISGSATYMSGMVGSFLGIISNCTTRGEYSYGTHSSGIGTSLQGSGKVINCQNFSNIKPSNDGTGAAAGIAVLATNSANIAIIGCLNAGEIVGGSTTGSAAGICGSASVVNVVKENNVNIGTLAGIQTYPLYFGVA